MKKVLAVLLGLVTSIALAELGLRVVARFHAPTRYLVTVGDGAEQPVFDNLEAYLASHANLVPHRDFLNYWNNAFGLNDMEFVVPKPRGRFRIMALGDSFTYGLVAYPDGAMTRLEEALRAACTGVDLDLLNFGIGGAGVWDYKTLFELAGPTFDPDLVLVNFYLGNDGPDLFARPPSFRRVPARLRKFYLARYVVNVVQLMTGLERHAATDSLRSQGGTSPSARGGEHGRPRVTPPAGRRSADRTDLHPGEVRRDHVGRVPALRSTARGTLRSANLGPDAGDPRHPPAPGRQAGSPLDHHPLSIGAPGLSGGPGAARG